MLVPKFKLNFGGVVGAVGCVIAAIAVMALLKFPAHAGKLVMLAAIGGGALGNWIWSLALPSSQNPP